MGLDQRNSIIREYTSDNLRKNESGSLCTVQTALNASFAFLSQWQFGVNFAFVLSQLLDLADKQDVYSLLLQILWGWTPVGKMEIRRRRVGEGKEEEGVGVKRIMFCKSQELQAGEGWGGGI